MQPIVNLGTTPEKAEESTFRPSALSERRFFRFFGCTLIFILAIVLSVLFVKQRSEKTIAYTIRTEIPEEEQRALELFFRELICRNGFGFTLFGDKPISVDAYFDPIPVDNILLDNSSSYVLKTGCSLWEKYRSLFSSEHYHLCIHPTEDRQLIFMVNKPAFLQTVSSHLEYFQQILGKEITPHSLLSLIEAGMPPLDALKHHEGLFGLLLGYGKTNAECYHRRELLQDFTLKSSSIQEKKFLEERLVGIGDDGSPLDLISVPRFVGIRDTPETLFLVQNYRKQKKKIVQTYQNAKFLETTLTQFCKKNPD